MKTKILRPTEENLEKMAQSLKRESPVAFATETVYGLGASVFCKKSIQKIFSLKNRPRDNPLIVHIDSINWVYELAKEIPDDFFLLAEKFFPGPLTLILPKKEVVSDLVSANHPTIAIRMPSSHSALRLISKVKEPLVAPSANLSGKPSPTKAEHVFEDFNGKIPFILDDGPCHYGIESTILYLSKEPILLRFGAIPKKEIEMVLQKPVLVSKDLTIAPGMKYRHYAPKARVTLFLDRQDLMQNLQNTPHIKRMILSSDPIGSLDTNELNTKTLYDLLRKADRTNCEEVLIYCSLSDQKDLALMNRIEKASSKL